MRTHFALFLLILFNGRSNGDVTDCEMSSKQVHYHLRTDLLCDYYYDVRPKMDHRNATKVFIRMIVQTFSYDMYASLITINSWLPMAWVDDHLKWTPSNYDDVNLIHFSASSIWTPDLTHINKYYQDGIQRAFDSGVECIVRSTGKVTCVSPNKYEALCSADLRKYPYDQQICTVRLGSLVHTGEEIDYQFTKSPVVIENRSNGLWKIVNVSTIKISEGYASDADTFVSLDFVFTIQRLASYHGASIIVPALVIVTITLLILCLNAAGDERFYLVIVNILFHFLYIQNLMFELPAVGEYPPYILILTRDSLILCMAEFIITIMLRRMIRTSLENVGWISRIIGTLIQSRIGRAILMFDNSVKAIAIAKGEEDGTNIIERQSNANNLDFIVFAKLLDRLLCTIYLIIYISMFVRLIP